MELREVIGRRRSIRFLLPYRPVEPEKIQRMLEAAASLRIGATCRAFERWPCSGTPLPRKRSTH